MKVLVVEDHSAMIEGYKSILSFSKLASEIEFIIAPNSQKAFEYITNPAYVFEIIVLDLILPPYDEQNITSGSDLAFLIKKSRPLSRLMIITSHTEALIIYPLLKSISPDAFLVKSDFSADELIEAFEGVIHGNTYFSPTVQQCVKEINKQDKHLDSYNRKIVLLLSQGVKTKNIPAHMNLSLSAVDKRKVQIKDYLGIDKGNDEDILREARKAGLI